MLKGAKDFEIFTFDKDGAKAQFTDPVEMLAKVKPRTLVVSPGVPLAQEWIQKFEADGGTVTSELELACQCLEGEKILGITGSVGKSTTTALLGEGAKTLDPNAFVGGNFGTPLAEYAADVLEGKRPRAQWVVLELSSYQLERSRNLKLEGAAIISLLPNHLERYPNLEAYYSAKWDMVTRTPGPVVLNDNGGDLHGFADFRLPPPLRARTRFVSARRGPVGDAEFTAMKLLGDHNRDNLAVAVELATAVGWDRAKFLPAMLNFAGLSHRLERIGTWRDITFVNDSKATAMESVISAVTAVLNSHPKGKVHLLLGGRDKKLPWERLSVLSAYAQVEPMFFGECAKLAKEKSNLNGPVYDSLKQLVPLLRQKAKAGDWVLLSPGGTSLDEFKNFEDRGAFFAKRMQELFHG